MSNSKDPLGKVRRTIITISRNGRNPQGRSRKQREWYDLVLIN